MTVAKDEYAYAVAGVVIKQGDKLVLQHRDDIPTIENPGTYSPWGGKIEDGEEPLQAAIRELNEETGVVVQESDLRLLSHHDEITNRPELRGKKIEAFIYIVELSEGTEVKCFEGQGIAVISTREDIPKDKSFPGLDLTLDKYYSGNF